MKKSYTALAVGAATLVAVPVVAGAQETDESTTTTTDPAATEESTTPHGKFGDSGHRGHHGHFGFRGLEGLTDLLGLTEEELTAALADGQTLADLAEAQGIDVEAVVDALVADAEVRIAAAVDDEHLTQEQADERIADIEARITEMVDSVFELPTEQFGRGGPGGFGFGITSITDLLGIDAQELFTALHDGTTLGELAGANGVSNDDLRTAMLDGIEERFAQSVTDGRLTQAEADEMLAALEGRVDDIINGVMPTRPEGFEHDGFRGRHGFGSDSDSSTDTPEVSLAS